MTTFITKFEAPDFRHKVARILGVIIAVCGSCVALGVTIAGLMAR